MKYFRIFIAFTLFLLFNYPCFSQTGMAIGSELVEHNLYLKAVDTLKNLLKLYNKEHKVKAGSFNHTELDQALALYGSFIGEEYSIRYKARKVINQDALGAVQFTNALPYIAKQAANRSILMINEDHTQPKHRLLTYNLLDTLYKLGYRYLAAETLAANDSSILNLKYPGAYTPEPNMANMLKKAVRLGYKLIAYESTDTTEYNSRHPFYADNLRELEQARNLYQIFVKDSKAKVLVHAGHGHIWKRTDDDLIPMAKYFSIISGIDPFCVNQSVNNLQEFTLRLDKVVKTTGIPYVVLNDKSNAQVSAYDIKGSYDCLVAWPTPQIVKGRKDYMLAKRGNKEYVINLNTTDAGNLLQIKSSLVGDAIPVDQFVVKPHTFQYASALEAGTYLMQVINRNGIITWKKQMIVK